MRAAHQQDHRDGAIDADEKFPTWRSWAARCLLGWEPLRLRMTHRAADTLLILLGAALVESPAKAAGQQRLGLRGRPTAAASHRR